MIKSKRFLHYIQTRTQYKNKTTKEFQPKSKQKEFLCEATQRNEHDRIEDVERFCLPIGFNIDR